MRRLNKTLPDQPVEALNHPVLLDDLTPLWKLELVMLGALIANKKLRDMVELEDFTNEDIRHAVADLKGVGVTDRGYTDLASVMRKMLVEWNGGESSPLPKMIERLKVCADYHRAKVKINTIFAGTQDGSNKSLQSVVDAVGKLE